MEEMVLQDKEIIGKSEEVKNNQACECTRKRWTETSDNGKHFESRETFKFF